MDNATLPRGKVGWSLWPCWGNFGCLIPFGVLRTEGKTQSPPAGERGDSGRGPGIAGWQRVAPAASALRPARWESRRGGERVSGSAQGAGLSFPPHRQPLAGHQPVLEERGSGGRGSHYRAASPPRLCACVPALRIGLRHLHKAPAMHYSAAVLP